VRECTDFNGEKTEMPELPDVEVFRQYMAATSLHKKISKVEIQNTRILKKVSRDRLKRSVAGSSLEGTDRHGKYLFGNLDTGDILVLHFGMTGFLKYFKKSEARPNHPRLTMHFQRGYRLVYDNQRLLGSVFLITDKPDFICKKKLGIDALSIDFKEFAAILNRGRGNLKSTLMNQKLLAGIGNVYSDEILFQARLHPKAAVNRLTSKQQRALFKKMKQVLSAAVERRADPDRMPRTFLLSHRDEEGRCPRCGGGVRKTKISGRSAYFCPVCQKQG
jgi:formamidopyrimidine-DNA glycosylase